MYGKIDKANKYIDRVQAKHGDEWAREVSEVYGKVDGIWRIVWESATKCTHLRSAYNTLSSYIHVVYMVDDPKLKNTAYVKHMHESKFSQNSWKTSPSYQVWEKGRVKEVDIVFNAFWVKQGRYRNMVTWLTPFVLFIDLDGVLRVQYGKNGEVVELATGCSKLSTTRGWKSLFSKEVDQGVIVAYVKTDGKVYYRSFAQQVDGTWGWENETEVTGLLRPAYDISVFRTNDYRAGFLVEYDNHELSWLLTSRSWAGMSVGDETVAVTSIVDVNMILTHIVYKSSKSHDEKINAHINVHECELKCVDIPQPKYAKNIDEFEILLVMDANVIIQGDSAHTTFSVKDSHGTNFTVTKVETNDSLSIYDNTKSCLKLTCMDLSTYKTALIVSYSPTYDAIVGEAGQSITPFSILFYPVGLVPVETEPPVPEWARNINMIPRLFG